jgi:hypothetical protein
MGTALVLILVALTFSIGVCVGAIFMMSRRQTS